MPKVLYSKAALKDLLQIQEYITENWGKDAAKQITKNILENVNELKRHPGLGVSLGKMIDFPTDYRYLFIEKNYVFYHLKDNLIHIVRIANERQDFMHLLFGIKK